MAKEEDPHINPYGFREYDARWLYPKDINGEGIKNVGQGLGTQIALKIKKKVSSFQTRNIPHFGHEKIIQKLISKNKILIIKVNETIKLVNECSFIFATVLSYEAQGPIQRRSYTPKGSGNHCKRWF